MMKVAIIGATGYSALELIRLLNHHPYVTITEIISHSHYGELLSDLYPHLKNIMEKPLIEYDLSYLEKEVDLLFFATPAGISKDLIPDVLKTSLQCVDLSGDFRLLKKDYEKWYKKTAPASEIQEKATFGLAEIYPEEIRKAVFISNPGCYSTAALLGLIPIIKTGLVTKKGIIIDAKSGTSGAGRTLSSMTHFSEMDESLIPYKFGEHQHTPEIEYYLSKEVGEEINVTLTTHLVPMTRGLLCTMYVPLTQPKTAKEIEKLYQEFYEKDLFVRLHPLGSLPQTKQVVGSNYVAIGIHVNERTQQLIIVTAIDNLVKGAAGQAIQNMNLMNGWSVQSGLDYSPVYP
ncbi:N-acetyl-gamma-glutamyl-phosphate reductase [Carnobacterium jeotgali]|uniref:N-acetyl-gamma-glutamyl-phosphate reductase n=1 Tax=Carnobacterium jeotgali TaxID=545534 RepID=UPI000493579C|nr:N-acetyl-gamma-glutamyl-phosphate reductase [Carnobacterium jeotgali]